MVRPTERVPAEVLLVDEAGAHPLADELAVEEALEIRLAAGEATRSLAVTMRTPGADPELAAGFLFAEGIVGAAGDLRRIRRRLTAEGRTAAVEVELAADELPDLSALERHVLATSACGLCGRASTDGLALGRNVRLADGPRLAREILIGLPDALRRSQDGFRATGGLHAAGLFTAGGELVVAREDIGRHNALDKLLGWGLLAERLPFADAIVVVSGRASYELVQKALAAEVPVLCAVSAPSSAAVALARSAGMTLVGFLRGGRFNVYSGRQRLALAVDRAPTVPPAPSGAR